MDGASRNSKSGSNSDRITERAELERVELFFSIGLKVAWLSPSLGGDHGTPGALQMTGFPTPAAPLEVWATWWGACR